MLEFISAFDLISVILTVAVFHHLIDEAPVNGILQLSYKVILRNQLVQTCELDLIPVLPSVARHHIPRPPCLYSTITKYP